MKINNIKMSIKLLNKINNSPQAISSGDTRPDKSGSSPYQKIQSSLAAVNDNGGGAGDGAIPKSKIPPAPPPPLVTLFDGVAATRRQTHNISPARHREKLDSTGSSSGVPPNPPTISPQTSFRHFIPQRSV